MDGFAGYKTAATEMVPDALLSTRQYYRLTSVLDADEHLAVKVTYVIYQKIIAAYADATTSWPSSITASPTGPPKPSMAA